MASIKPAENHDPKQQKKQSGSTNAKLHRPLAFARPIRVLVPADKVRHYQAVAWCQLRGRGERITLGPFLTEHVRKQGDFYAQLSP
jgi:hypothetical protein